MDEASKVLADEKADQAKVDDTAANVKKALAGLKPMKAIRIAHLPNKVEYPVGSSIDLTGLEVEAVYTDDTTKKITGYKVSNTKVNSVGNNTIKVTYGDLEATFIVKGTTSEGGTVPPAGDTTQPDKTPEIPSKVETEKTEIPSNVVTAKESADGYFYTNNNEKVTNAIVKTEKGRYIVDEKGEKYVSAMVTVKNGNTYITDTTGGVITGKMIETNGSTYYVTKGTGKVVKETVFKFSGSKYYAAKDGEIAKGKIVTVKGKKYYATKGTGRFVQDRLFKLNGKKYIASKSGALQISKWVAIGNKKYYCNKNGEVTKSKKK